jgi:hypothetical protein
MGLAPVRLVIVRNIWQKLSNVERKVSLIVTHFWRLFHEYLAKPCLSSQIFGQTALVSSYYAVMLPSSWHAVNFLVLSYYCNE